MDLFVDFSARLVVGTPDSVILSLNCSTSHHNVVRIAASIVEIVEQTEKSPTTTIITVAAILPSVGLSPLLIAFISYAKAM